MRRLVAELGAEFDIWAVGMCDSPDALAGIDCVPAITYSEAEITGLPYHYERPKLKWAGSGWHNDFPVLKFFLEQRSYEYYWIIEYDVRFTGPWPVIFSDLATSGADLLCTTLQTLDEHPDWYLWPTLSTGGDHVPPWQRIKGFMPFCRISRAALAAVDHAYRRGWGGHYEATWPTISRRADLLIEDIGGNGSFVPPDRRGKYYSCTPNEWSHFPGTFIWRPIYAESKMFDPFRRPIVPGGNTLWHPVK